MESQIIKIQTPKKFLLDGILFGSSKAKNIIIFVHGLGSNLFSQTDLIERLVNKNNSVLAFNNRGNGIVTRVKRLNKKELKGYESHLIGMSHEVFTDCVDDIEGVIKSLRKFGAENIFLLGHSTGCQKSIYYLAKKNKPSIKGVILLAPMSDFADTFKFANRKIYQRALSYAQKMLKMKKADVFLPKKIWPYMTDAQRFLSLYTPDSLEEIFSYASNRNPKILKSVKKPKLVILAEKDEYRDREISEIAGWFEKNMAGNNAEIKLVKNAPHNFHGYASEVSKIIKKWL